MTSEKLDNAVQLIKAGNRQAALPILKGIIQANPNDENAWLWLYACVEKVDEKKYCLQRALAINPDNQPARRALANLTDSAPRPAQPVAAEKELAPQAAPKSNPNAKRGKRPWGIVLGVGLTLLLCAVGGFYLVGTGQAAALVASLSLLPTPSLTPSLTPTSIPTETVTPSPSPTPSETATRRPSATLIPALETPTPHPTIPPFTPGNPTATPLGSEITDPNFIKGLAAYKEKHYEEVISLMSLVIEANPDLAPPYRHRGMASLYLHDCSSGLADMEKALSIDPNYASAWFGRGDAKHCLGDDAQMLQDYQKALSLDPSLTVVHHNLGVYYYNAGNYQHALDEYSLAIEIDPQRADVWSGKSEALYKLGRYDECIVSANQTIEINKQEWLAYSDRAQCELAQHKNVEALRDYKLYAANQPDDVMGQYNVGVAYGHLGDAYYGAGQYTQAIAAYKEAVSLINGDAHSYCQLSYSYFEVKQYRNALDAAKSSIAINPGCGGHKLVVVQARSAYALGDYAQALDYINLAFTKGWDVLDYYYRGIILQAAGRKAEAIQDLKTFLAGGYSGPEVADAQARLAKLAP